MTKGELKVSIGDQTIEINFSGVAESTQKQIISASVKKFLETAGEPEIVQDQRGPVQEGNTSPGKIKAPEQPAEQPEQDEEEMREEYAKALEASFAKDQLEESKKKRFSAPIAAAVKKPLPGVGHVEEKVQAYYKCPRCNNRGRHYVPKSFKSIFCHDCGNTMLLRKAVDAPGWEKDSFGNTFIAGNQKRPDELANEEETKKELVKSGETNG